MLGGRGLRGFQSLQGFRGPFMLEITLMAIHLSLFLARGDHRIVNGLFLLLDTRRLRRVARGTRTEAIGAVGKSKQ